MAYNVRNINVLDLKPSTGVGVALPFNNVVAFKTVYTTQEQLKYNIINYLLTDTRERIFNPQFGAGLRSKLFEQITTQSAADLESSIKAGVENNFPNVSVSALTVTSDPDRNIFYVQFSYVITNTNQSDNILIGING